MLILLLAACPPSKLDDTATAIDDTAATCADTLAEFQAESLAIRTCTDAADCGQELTGTSCGCTQNLVARGDADTTHFYELIAGAGECDLGLVSDCSCPEAYGFDCVDSLCTWDYTTRSEPYPDCTTEHGSGFELDSLVLVGDTLEASVSYGGGCEAHVFTTCWPDGAFAESSPVQAFLELHHDNGNDSCDAWMSEVVSVDLLPLKAAWQTAYGGGSGTIIVHLAGESVEYTF